MIEDISPRNVNARSRPEKFRKNMTNTLKLSSRWEQRFALIEKAGGPKLQKFKDLTFGERFSIMMSFWAFFFGPFYYLYMRMWRKAISYSVVGYGLVFIVLFLLILSGFDDESLTRSLGFGVGALFGGRAYIDYYRKMVLNQNGWW